MKIQYRLIDEFLQQFFKENYMDHLSGNEAGMFSKQYLHYTKKVKRQVKKSVLKNLDAFLEFHMRVYTDIRNFETVVASIDTAEELNAYLDKAVAHNPKFIKAYVLWKQRFPERLDPSIFKEGTKSTKKRT